MVPRSTRLLLVETLDGRFNAEGDTKTRPHNLHASLVASFFTEEDSVHDHVDLSDLFMHDEGSSSAALFHGATVVSDNHFLINLEGGPLAEISELLLSFLFDLHFF
jgi:hypothetical protein